MNSAVVLDLETKYRFQDVNNDLSRLGVSVVGIYDYSQDAFRAFAEDELRYLFPILESCTLLIGFNLKKFDLEVLKPYYVGKIHQLPALDLLEDVERCLGFRVALDDLVRATLDRKKEGHGLTAIEYYRKKEMEKLKKYCLSDVRLTRDLYEFGKKEGKVYISDVKGKREIPVNWGNFTSIKDIPLTLPI